jgi:hypothetical protein
LECNSVMLVQMLKIPDSIDIIEAVTDNNILPSSYIYTDSKHSNPLCRAVPLEILQKERMKQDTLNYYDKDKYKEMILDAAETVLCYFGFDRTVYGNLGKNRKKKKWYKQLHEERTKDI